MMVIRTRTRMLLMMMMILMMIKTKKLRCNVGANGWCSERRKNSSSGAVQRCAERTR